MQKTTNKQGLHFFPINLNLRAWINILKKKNSHTNVSKFKTEMIQSVPQVWQFSSWSSPYAITMSQCTVMLGSKLPSKTPTHSLAAVNTASEKKHLVCSRHTSHYSVQNLQWGKQAALKKTHILPQNKKYFLFNAVSIEN